jgi:hypothetical protein
VSSGGNTNPRPVVLLGYLDGLVCFVDFVSFCSERARCIHPRFEKADRLSQEAIGAAIEVHRILGPGLLERIEIRLVDGLSRMILPGANQS